MIKDPNATLPYSVDWVTPDPKTGKKWMRDGDTITTSTWTVPPGITKQSDGHDDGVATIWLSGGTAGTTYKLTNRITTAQGCTDERTIPITVRER